MRKSLVATVIAAAVIAAAVAPWSLLAEPPPASSECLPEAPRPSAFEAVAPAPAAEAEVQTLLPAAPEPLFLGGTCEQRCERGYDDCLVLCSKTECLISCEDQRCYCLRNCGLGCGEES
ncbi:MAG TPA: hypothetical protein VF100_06345 [Thermoanaerobaculia bacterium]